MAVMSVRENNLVMSAEVHEGEETEQTVVVGIEVAIVEGLVLHVPQMVDEVAALVVATHH